MNATSYSNPQQVNINKVTLIFTPLAAAQPLPHIGHLMQWFTIWHPNSAKHALAGRTDLDFTVQAQLAADAVPLLLPVSRYLAWT